ncbi:MAG TPA: isoprenylcysteine carboxylmethyltransferase family protein [Geomonas sp.]
MRTTWWRGKRGEWYVAFQAVLFVLVVFGPQTLKGIPAWPHAARLPAFLLGGVLLLAGFLLACAGAACLGRNLTPLPHPKDDALLVETGAYRLVRHPIYGGIILMAYGWSLLAQSWLTLAYATVVLAFLDIKSRREERWLKEKFPGYDAYRKRVRKLIPFLY